MTCFVHDDLLTAIADWIVSNTDIDSGSLFGWRYVALLDTTGTEVTGGSYARQDLLPYTSWDAANERAYNSSAISFTGMPAVTVRSWRLYDASSGGSAWVGAQLGADVPVSGGGTFTFAIDDLRFSLNLAANLGLTDASKEAICRWLAGSTSTLSISTLAGNTWIDTDGSNLSGTATDLLDASDQITTEFYRNDPPGGDPVTDFVTDSWGAFDTGTGQIATDLDWVDLLTTTGTNVGYYVLGGRPTVVSALNEVRAKVALDSAVAQTNGNLLSVAAGDMSFGVAEGGTTDYVVVDLDAALAVTSAAPGTTSGPVGLDEATMDIDGSAAWDDHYRPLTPVAGPTYPIEFYIEIPDDVVLDAPGPSDGGWSIGFLPFESPAGP